jgi:hypothetical protein
LYNLPVTEVTAANGYVEVVRNYDVVKDNLVSETKDQALPEEQYQPLGEFLESEEYSSLENDLPQPDSEVLLFSPKLQLIWTDGSDPYPELTTRQVLLKILSEQNFKLSLFESIPVSIRDIINRCLHCTKVGENIGECTEFRLGSKLN